MAALVKLGKMFEKYFCSQENQTLEFWIFKFHGVICWIKKNKYILLNTFRGKLSLLMTFDQFMSYSKWNNFMEKFYRKCSLKTNSRLFFYLWRIAKFLKQSTHIRYVIAILLKFVQISMLVSLDFLIKNFIL